MHVPPLAAGCGLPSLVCARFSSPPLSRPARRRRRVARAARSSISSVRRSSGATVTLMRDGQRAADTTSDAARRVHVRGPPGRPLSRRGRPRPDSSRAPRTRSSSARAGASRFDVGLQVGGVTQHVVVTAAAAELPQSQIGAVGDGDRRDAASTRSGTTDLLEPLRTVPGAGVVQTGARGGTTSLFVRGGASNFTKVLVDGVPANDIGGAFDFSRPGDDRRRARRGAARREQRALRQRRADRRHQHHDAPRAHAHSGSRRSRSTAATSAPPAPTRRSAAPRSASTTSPSYSHLQTDNNVPNNAYRNNTFAEPVRRDAGHDDQPQRHRCATSTRTPAAPTRSTSSGSPTIRRRRRTTTYASVVGAVADRTAAGRARSASASPIRTITT